jgi:hypothetical protein
MNWNDIELKLLAGMPIEIEGVGKLYSPTLKEYIKIGESLHNQYLSALLFDKKNIEGVEKDDISTFELLCVYCYHNQEFKDMFFKALKLVFKEEARMFADEQSVFFYFGELMDMRRITESNFGQIQEIVRKANWIKPAAEEEELDFANEEARKMHEEIERIKAKIKTKEKMNLHSIISGLSWKDNGVNIFNIFDLTIYQIYQGFFQTEQIDSYHFTLTGIYQGTVDGKNIKMPNIHWAKIIDNK